MKTRWSLLVFLILSVSAAAFAHGSGPGGSLRSEGVIEKRRQPEQGQLLAQTKTKPSIEKVEQSVKNKTLQLLEELREICPTCVVVQTAVPRACPPGCPACPAGSGWDARLKKCRKFRE